MGESTKPEVELAAVKTELRLIAKTLDEVKASLREVSTLSTTLNQIATSQKSYEQKFQDVDTRLGDLESRQASNTAFLNKIRGSVTTSAWIVRAVEAALIGAVGYMYTTVMDTREQVLTVNNQVQYLEREHQQIIKELSRAAKGE
ncbi:hypothetical protein [Paratractidigestivibacter sp.]|uniref:hypothetical protein n=1 Tax=Paratractidigestivibacter sp. TaxID=2847316 RepID=UPI002AC93377|nr:hypothetical protein [Paratractidigestivibacter sp.]